LGYQEEAYTREGGRGKRKKNHLKPQSYRKLIRRKVDWEEREDVEVTGKKRRKRRE